MQDSSEIPNLGFSGGGFVTPVELHLFPYIIIHVFGPHGAICDGSVWKNGQRLLPRIIEKENDQVERHFVCKELK